MTKSVRVLACAFVAVVASLSVVTLRSQDASAPRDATVERALKALHERIGVGPLECGRYPKPVTDEAALAASVQCVIDAAKQGRQAWMAVYGPGADAWVQGAFSGSDGIVRKFIYDTLGPLGDGHPTLGVNPCQFPKVALKDRGSFVTVDCVIR